MDGAGLHVVPSTENSQAPPLDLFVLLSLPLLIKTSACIEMVRWALGRETSIFSGNWHLNKLLSFSPAPASESGFRCSREPDLGSVTVLLV